MAITLIIIVYKLNLIQFVPALLSLVPPVITASPVSTVELLSPARLNLSCSADALPMPIFAWMKTLDDGSETFFNISNTFGNGKSITIMDISISDVNTVSDFSVNSTTAIDSGSYTCVAMNRLGSNVSMDSFVSVYGKFLYNNVISCTKVFIDINKNTLGTMSQLRGVD